MRLSNACVFLISLLVSLGGCQMAPPPQAACSSQPFYRIGSVAPPNDGNGWAVFTPEEVGPARSVCVTHLQIAVGGPIGWDASVTSFYVGHNGGSAPAGTMASISRSRLGPYTIHTFPEGWDSRPDLNSRLNRGHCAPQGAGVGIGPQSVVVGSPAYISIGGVLECQPELSP